MTTVTTSRRSTPFTRAVARDLAFATGSSYLPRGKHGLRELADEHDLFIVICQQGHNVILTAYKDKFPVISRIVSNHEEGLRERKIRRGIETSDNGVGDIMSAFCEVCYTVSDETFISFDGPQKRWMKLTLCEGNVCDT